MACQVNGIGIQSMANFLSLLGKVMATFRFNRETERFNTIAALVEGSFEFIKPRDITPQMVFNQYESLCISYLDSPPEGFEDEVELQSILSRFLLMKAVLLGIGAEEADAATQ